MWSALGGEGLAADAAWPEFDAAAAAEPRVTLVVQVQGKVRDRIEVPSGLGQDAGSESKRRRRRARTLYHLSSRDALLGHNRSPWQSSPARVLSAGDEPSSLRRPITSIATTF